jgi:GTP-binding protein
LPPESGPEIAFAGRSNAGKSSAINRMVGQIGLAYASKLPGRTRELNFFALRGGGYLVDLPGYGFARTPRHKQRAWSGAIDHYLAERAALAAVVLVMDIRHAPVALDLEFIRWLRDVRQVGGRDEGTPGKCPPILCLLSKVDKLTQSERTARLKVIRADLTPQLGAEDLIVPFSAVTGAGLRECDAWIGALFARQGV